MSKPTHHTLTRVKHPTHNPEVLESYVDSDRGEPWTGGYLKHEVGDSEVVPRRVAEKVMNDPGLQQHYTCDPPIEPEPAAGSEAAPAPAAETASEEPAVTEPSEPAK